MDTLTHCLTGALLAAALRQPNPSNAPLAAPQAMASADADLLPDPAPAIPPNRGLLALMILASNLPDIDAILNVLPYGFSMRRAFFHGLIGVPLLAYAAAALARWLTPQFCMSYRFLLILGASILHVIMDLPNSFGVAFLAPFSDQRFELASVFVIDLVFWGTLVLALVLPFILPRQLGHRRGRIAVIALTFLTLYTGFCSTLRAYAQSVLQALVAPGESLYVYHEPFGPGLWRGVVRETDGDYRVYSMNPITALTQSRDSSVNLVRTVTDDSESTTVARIRELHEGARRVERFFRSPVWTVQPDGSATIRDLRFSSVRLSSRQPFVFQFRPEPNP